MNILDTPHRPVAVTNDDFEPVSPGAGHDIDPADIGLRAEAIGHDPPVADAREKRLNFGMIEAQHRCAVERHILDELDERILDRVERSIMIEMLGVDIGDNRHGAIEAEE